jgi:hypothetical protein
MKRINIIGPMVVTALLAIGSAFAQRTAPLADNAALRYWAAFSELQDAAITDQEAKELNAALDNMGPYDFSKYKDLLQKNTPALGIMARGTSLSNCDWGLDYGLGEDVPVEYARKALALGRLNVLYAIQQYHSGNKEGAVRALAAGLRFSQDVSNGGSLFATLVAKDLLVIHLMAVSDGLRMGQLSPSQQSQLHNAVAALGDGLDWSGAARRDLQALRMHYAKDPQAAAALNRIVSSYSAFLNDQSKLPILTEAINGAPQELASVIPNPKRVLEQKQELADKLQQTRGLLR